MAIEMREVHFGSALYPVLLAIRYEVLRKPLGMEMREKDVVTDAGEYHLAAFDNGQPIGCVLLRPLSDDVMQLRQMAVLEPYRGKNIGAELAKFAECFAVEKGFKTIEARARKNVQGFYEKLDYESRADEFTDEHTLKMRKSLGSAS